MLGQATSKRMQALMTVLIHNEIVFSGGAEKHGFAGYSKENGQRGKVEVDKVFPVLP